MTKNKALAAATATEQTRGLRDALATSRNTFFAARTCYAKVEAEFNEAHTAAYNAALAKLESEDDA